MKNLIYILLLFTIPLHGQYTLKVNGSTVTNGGGSEMRIQDDALPLTYFDLVDDDDSDSTTKTYYMGPIDFEDATLGVTSESSWQTYILDQYGVDTARTISTSWRATVPSDCHPTFVDYTADSAGTGTSVSSRGLQLSQPEDMGNLEHIPMNQTVVFFNETKETDLYYSFDREYVWSSGWASASASDEFKMHALMFGVGRDPSDLSTFYKVADDNTFFDGDYSQGKMKLMPKGSDGSNNIHIRVYPFLASMTAYLSDDLYDPDDYENSTYYEDISAGYRTNYVIRGVFETDTTGFFEIFINKRLAYRMDDYPIGSGTPLKMRTDSTITWDSVNLDMHWGGASDEYPTGSKASVVDDNLAVYSVDEYKNTRSPDNRVLN